MTYNNQCKTCNLPTQYINIINNMYENGEGFIKISRELKSSGMPTSVDSLRNHYRKHYTGASETYSNISSDNTSDHNPEFRPSGIEINQDGKGYVQTPPIKGDDLITDFSDILIDMGIDPDEFEILGTARVSKWKNKEDGEYLTSYRVNIQHKSTLEKEIEDILPAIQEFKPQVPDPKETQDHAFVFVAGDLQLGKALSDDTPILTSRGWVNHGDIVPGDFVYGPDGKLKEVLAVTGSTEQDLYEVRFDKDVVIKATGDHLWQGTRRYHPNGYKDNPDIPNWEWRDCVYTTKQIAEFPRHENVNGIMHTPRSFNVQLTKPIEFAERDDLAIDPYLLGLWLGDGKHTAGDIYAHIDDTQHIVNEVGGIVYETSNVNVNRINVPGLYSKLKLEGLFGNKHIPQKYLESSIEQRLALLQGLMDTDGYCSMNGTAEFVNTNKSITDGVEFILSSLGIKFKVVDRIGKINGVEKKPFRRINFQTNTDIDVFRMARKKSRSKTVNTRFNRHRQIQEIVPAGRGMAQCLTVEGSLYLAGKELVVTHNCDGDGTEGIVKRYRESLQKAVDKLNSLDHMVSEILISWVGDCIEGMVSQGGRNSRRTELTTTQQVRLLRKLMTETIMAFAPLSSKVTVVSVPGNHDEAQREPVSTDPSDSWAVDALVAVSEALKFNTEAFGHVECKMVPYDEMTTTVEVAGTKIGHAHGHQWTRGKHFDWWSGQHWGGHEVGDADILLAGHFHTGLYEQENKKYFIRVPSMEKESTYFRHKTGKIGNPSAVTFLTKNGKLKFIDFE